MKNFIARLNLIIAIFLMVACGSNSNLSLITPAQLTCEYLDSTPLIDIEQPRLSWINIAATDKHGLAQSAYQIRVASSEKQLEKPDLWDTYKVNSEISNRIVYQGKPLQSMQSCWWQVRVWDNNNQVSEWSSPARWNMGLLDTNLWKAKWIGAPWQGEEPLPKSAYPEAMPDEMGPAAPMLRKGLTIEKDVKEAVAYVTGLGYFEFYTNGKKVGDDVLVPNQTNYGKRPNLANSSINVPDNFRRYKVMYLRYDITEMLLKGENVFGCILGNGFYNPGKFWAEGYGTPRFLGQIQITYTDGTQQTIVSDETWKIAKSPIVKNMVYYGETYDATKEQDGWNAPGFDDSSWSQAAIKKAPEGELVAHSARTDKVMETLSPVAIKKLENGNYIVDFGEEISGWVRLNKVDGPAGHKIDIAFNSNLYSGDNTYICDGNAPASYAPRFNWFVFSGVEIKNWPGELTAEDITAEAVYTQITPSAHFETSNELFNQINKIWRRSQTDNMHGGIASDCPHRERSPYTGDGQVAISTVMHNYDARNFYQKWIDDIYEAQIVTTGYVPNGAPWQPGCGGGVAWGAAIAIMPWEFYVHYGAKDMLEKNYPAMKEYIRYMQTWVDENGIMFSQRRGANGEILKWFNLGEWVAPGPTVSDDMVHTFYFWMCADITYKTALILGDQEGATVYQKLADNTKEAFHRKYYDKEHKTYGIGGGNIFALKMGVPKDREAAVIETLANDLEANGRHIDTGILGTRYFFEILAKYGLNRLAYDAMNTTDEPGFGHWIELGSTTTREKWDESGSHNHPMFGGGLVWFYKNLAGIQADPSAPGYKHIIFRPQPIEELEYVEYDTETVYGKASIRWANRTKNFTMKIQVPVGSTARVFVPTDEKASITVNDFNDQKIAPEFYTDKGFEDGYRVYDVTSGSYIFTALK